MFLFVKRSGMILTLLAVLAAALATLAGCGGGGGGGGDGSPSTTGTTTGVSTTGTTTGTANAPYTLTGTLKDTSTSTPLSNRTVSVAGTALSGTTDANGVFSIANVTAVSTISLQVKEVSSGALDGSVSVDTSKFSGNPRNIGVVTIDLSGLPPPPPL